MWLFPQWSLHEGRYCLNDLHKAAGGDKNDMPSNWLRSKQAQDLIAELTRSSDLRNAPVETLQGGDVQGTFVVKEMVYAYAMWISAAFQLKVIKAYDAMVTGQMTTQQQVAAIGRKQLACTPFDLQEPIIFCQSLLLSLPE
ncbi:KilA-N domain-containing protein [Aeromonas caviae]|uniref:KilA-N domain-containing protein n=1 Tax=Aeromonas caviae TaxID=648 RepID=UPI002253FEEA|nr:KilA-N domain-containing protein [Aeromonas caviae]MCX4073713.1 KilA-N domain-containing protein [Aeromonas caviae]